MYPFIRLFLAISVGAWRGAVPFDSTYQTWHRILPQDIDIFGELNNGRMLTIMDLNRLPFARASGLMRVIRKNGWGMAVAGVSVRYRHRIKMFDHVRITTRAVGRDARFLYLVQTMWKGETAACSALYRATVYNAGGIVPTQIVADMMGQPDWNPDMPDWVTAWITADAQREWPPKH